MFIIVFNLHSNNIVTFVSRNINILGDDTFTKYSIFKYKDKAFLLYKSKHFNSDEIVSVNQIKDFASEYKEEDITISIPNDILIGKDLVGTYTNGFTFRFENIISIVEDVLEEEEIINYLQRGNIHIETKIN